MKDVSAFDNDIMNSETISQLIMRGNLSGVDFNPEYLFYHLNERFFYNLGSCIDEDVALKKRILRILKSGTKEFKRYICDKNTVEFIVRAFCDPNRESLGNNETIINFLISYLQIINKSSKKMLRNLKDRNGNNILMLLIKMQKYDDISNMFTKVENLPFLGQDESNDLISPYIMTKTSEYRFVNFMLREAKVDPHEKNSEGKCFCDYVNLDKVRIENRYYVKLRKSWNV